MMKKLFRKKTSETEEPDTTGSRTTTSPRTTGTGASTGTQGGRSTVPTGGQSSATGSGVPKAGSAATSSSAADARPIGTSATTGAGAAKTIDGASHSSTGTGSGVGGTGLGSGVGSSTAANGVAGGTGTGATGKAPLAHTESITERYHPGPLEPIEPRRQEMNSLMSEIHQMPPGDAPVDEALSASYDKKPWELAQEKTRQAEKEAASANLLADRANKALRDAQGAERAVQVAGDRHNQLLTEAEREKALLTDPSALADDYSHSKAYLAERQAEAERHNKALAALEAEVAAKKKDYEENKPLIEQHHKRVSRATEEYDEHIRQQDAIEGDKERLLLLATEAEGERGMATGEVERLTHELMAADDFAAEKERDFINAKEARRVLAAQLAAAKDKHSGAETAFLSHRKNADTAVQNADGYVEKSSTLRKKLEEFEEEHTRMVNLEKDREGEFNLAAAKLEGLRAEGDPKRHALAEAESALNAKRAELEAAQNRSREAEGRYNALMKEADEHHARGQSAAQDAKHHLSEFEKLRKEAQLHGDRHKQLWGEAMQHGSAGSDAATSAFQKLEQKIESFVHPHHSST